MKRSLLVAALLAVAISACAKKEEPAELPPPATLPTLPAATSNAPADTGTPAPAAEPAAPGAAKPAN